MTEIVKHCPSCRDEFQGWVERCPDCDVPLAVGEPGAVETAPAAEMPPVSELELVASGDPWRARELAEHLQAGGIGCRVEGGGERGGLGVYVAARDLPEAVVLVQALQRESLGEEADAEMAGADLCPGCEAPLAEDALECPSCGLAFPEA